MIHALRGPFSRRTQFWLACLLLIVATLLPSACVLWLVRKTVESEKLVVEQLMQESLALRLENAEKALLEEFEQRLAEAHRVGGEKGEWNDADIVDAGLAEAVASWEGVRPALEGTFDTDRARAVLGSIRKRLEASAGENPGLVVRTALADQEAWSLRFDDGRSVAAMALEMALARLSPGARLDPETARLVDELVLRRGPRRLTDGQRARLARRSLEVDVRPSVETLLRNHRLVADWQTQAGLDARSPPGERVVKTDRYVGIVDREQEFALVYRRDGFEQRWLRDPDLGVQLVAVGAREGEANGAVQRRLAPPLDWLVLQPSPGPQGLAAPPVNPTGAYFWIGGIVLALSLVSGGATALFIRAQLGAAQMKNDLVATVSHELKTPIASIRLLVDTMRDPTRALQVDREEYLSLIDRENRRLGHLIDNFLSFSRLERNKRSFELRRLSPIEAGREAEAAFRDRFGEQEFDLRVDFDPDLPDIAADREALSMALGNLLENALKYGDRARRIDFRLTRSAKGAVFEVEDYGAGIDRKDRRRIFDRFYQASRERGHRSSGVGLGLSIVDFVVANHKGWVEVSSELGKGSVFRIMIPYA